MWETIRLFFTDFKNTPLKDRIFALMSLLWFITIGVALAIILYQNSVTNEVRKERDSALNKLDICRDNNLKDNKDYANAILKATADCDDKWKAKIEAKDELNRRYLEEKAADLERRLKELTIKSERLVNRSKKLENKIILNQ